MALLRERGVENTDQLKDMTVAALIHSAEAICCGAVTCERSQYAETDRRLDRLLTGRLTGYAEVDITPIAGQRIAQRTLGKYLPAVVRE